MPAVSIILPTFNRLEYLRPAIASVRKQGYRDWELIVADDGSGEETVAYLASLPTAQIRILPLAHSGNPSRVRNLAIAASRGRYIAFIDSDDIWAPNKLEAQMQALQQRRDCRWSYTACDRIDARGRPLANPPLARTSYQEGRIFAPLLTLAFSIAMPSVIATRELIDAIGGFDEQQHFGEFHDLCLRLALTDNVVAVRYPLCSIRAHQDHYSADRVGAHQSWMRLYEKMSGLTGDAHLREHCLRSRSLLSLKVARLQFANGERTAGLRTLQDAIRFSWRYPAWWYGSARALLKTSLLHPLIPRPWQ